MTLRELMTAIHLQQTYYWTVNGEGVFGVPFYVQRLLSGKYSVIVTLADDVTQALTFTIAPSPTSDPLDAELE